MKLITKYYFYLRIAFFRIFIIIYKILLFVFFEESDNKDIF